MSNANASVRFYGRRGEASSVAKPRPVDEEGTRGWLVDEGKPRVFAIPHSLARNSFGLSSPCTSIVQGQPAKMLQDRLPWFRHSAHQH